MDARGWLTKATWNGSSCSCIKVKSCPTQCCFKTCYRRTRYPKKGSTVLCQPPRVKYTFIDQHRTEFRLANMCRVLKVHRSGYYARKAKPQSNCAREDSKLLLEITRSYDDSYGIYGSPHIHHDLREAGIYCGVKRVARLMHQAKLKSIRGYRRHDINQVSRQSLHLIGCNSSSL